jgi:acetolactate synthase-1/2/3 large subunit
VAQPAGGILGSIKAETSKSKQSPASVARAQVSSGEQVRGARLLLEGLVREEVDTIFGYPGGAVLHIYDELTSMKEKLRHVLVRHEQGAIHMAEGYAKATGKVGVVLVTSGPGATNVVTGVANAYMDSTPLVVITGQVPRKVIGTDAFQEVDTIGITRPCTKYNYMVRNADEMLPIVKEAFHLARTGRPGPVLIDVPKDVSAEKGALTEDAPIRLPGYRPRTRADQREVEHALDRILQAKRPVFYVGGGIASTIVSQALWTSLRPMPKSSMSTLIPLRSTRTSTHIGRSKAMPRR